MLDLELDTREHGNFRDFFFTFNLANSADVRYNSQTYICRHNVMLLNFMLTFYHLLFFNMLCQLALSSINSISLEAIS